MPGEKLRQDPSETKRGEREGSDERLQDVCGYGDLDFVSARAIHDSSKQHIPSQPPNKKKVSPRTSSFTPTTHAAHFFPFAVFLSISHGFVQERAINKRGRVTESYHCGLKTGIEDSKMSNSSEEKACYTNLRILPGFGKVTSATHLQGSGTLTLWC